MHLIGSFLHAVRQIYWLQHCKRLANWLVCWFIGWCGSGVSYSDTCVYCLLLFLWPGLRVSPVPQPAVPLHSQRCQCAKFCPRSHKHPLPPAETSDRCRCGGREKKKKKVVLRLSFCWSLSLSISISQLFNCLFAFGIGFRLSCLRGFIAWSNKLSCLSISLVMSVDHNMAGLRAMMRLMFLQKH